MFVITRLSGNFIVKEKKNKEKGKQKTKQKYLRAHLHKSHL